ncbi:ABC transporter permease [bacterium]|nr:ABC transporter permease [bacterium]MBU1071825.1 ABC transporter permease [bacterium]MBU1675799.1 ABC transporter permease [bacterium]
MLLRTVIVKDLRRWWSDRNAVIVALLLPLVLTAILGLSFGGFGGEAGISAIPLAVVGDVPAVVRQFLDDALRETGLFDVTWTGRAEAERLVRTGEMRAALIIPDDLMTRLLRGDRVEVTLWKDINSEFKAGIVEQILERMLLYVRAGEAAYFGAWPDDWYPARGEADAIGGLFDDASTLDVYRRIRDGSAEARTAWEELQRLLDNQLSLQDAFERASIDLRVEDRTGEALAENEDARASRNMFDYFLPGMAVFFLMFSAGGAGGDIHREREGGTLRRMLVSPLRARDLLLGKWAFATGNGLLQLLILFAVGRLVFRLNLGPDPVALPIHALVTSAALASFFLVLAMLTRTEKQMGQVGTGIILFMAIIGGNFVPAEAMPAFIRSAARFTPNYWANEGFTAIVSYDRGLSAVTDSLSVLAGISAVLLVVALLLLHRRERRGELL